MALHRPWCFEYRAQVAVNEECRCHSESFRLPARRYSKRVLLLHRGQMMTMVRPSILVGEFHCRTLRQWLHIAGNFEIEIGKDIDGVAAYLAPRTRDDVVMLIHRAYHPALRMRAS